MLPQRGYDRLLDDGIGVTAGIAGGGDNAPSPRIGGAHIANSSSTGRALSLARNTMALT